VGHFPQTQITLSIRRQIELKTTHNYPLTTNPSPRKSPEIRQRTLVGHFPQPQFRHGETVATQPTKRAQSRHGRTGALNPATAGQARSTGTLGHLPQPVGHIPQNNKVKEIQILDDNYITT